MSWERLTLDEDGFTGLLGVPQRVSEEMFTEYDRERMALDDSEPEADDA